MRKSGDLGFQLNHCGEVRTQDDPHNNAKHFRKVAVSMLNRRPIQVSGGTLWQPLPTLSMIGP